MLFPFSHSFPSDHWLSFVSFFILLHETNIVLTHFYSSSCYTKVSVAIQGAAWMKKKKIKKIKAFRTVEGERLGYPFKRRLSDRERRETRYCVVRFAFLSLQLLSPTSLHSHTPFSLHYSLSGFLSLTLPSVKFPSATFSQSSLCPSLLCLVLPCPALPSVTYSTLPCL